jgi:hypothetical protein
MIKIHGLIAAGAYYAAELSCSYIILSWLCPCIYMQCFCLLLCKQNKKPALHLCNGAVARQGNDLRVDFTRDKTRDKALLKLGWELDWRLDMYILLTR